MDDLLGIITHHQRNSSRMPFRLKLDHPSTQLVAYNPGYLLCEELTLAIPAEAPPAVVNTMRQLFQALHLTAPQDHASERQISFLQTLCLYNFSEDDTLTASFPYNARSITCSDFRIRQSWHHVLSMPQLQNLHLSHNFIGSSSSHNHFHGHDSSASGHTSSTLSTVSENWHCFRIVGNQLRNAHISDLLSIEIWRRGSAHRTRAAARLHTLDLSSNDLYIAASKTTEIKSGDLNYQDPLDFSHCSQLSILNLSHNRQIFSVDTSRLPLSLTELNLSHCRLVQTPQLCSFANLQILSLENNGALGETYEPECLPDSLRTLNVASCRISGLHRYDRFKKLATLDMRDNPVSVCSHHALGLSSSVVLLK